MKSVSASDAKRRFAELLRRVAKGETISIMQRGVCVAKLVPVDFGERQNPKELVEQLRKLRRGVRMRSIAVRELIHEGHRY